MTKDDVSAALSEIGTLLELKGESGFRVNAYHNAARALTQLSGDLVELVETGGLKGVRGVGDSMREKIESLVRTGRIEQLDDLRAATPPGLLEMLRLPGVGPKKVKALYDELGCDTLDKLRAACESGRVSELKGFGDKSQAKILEGLRFVNEVGKRVRLDQAMPLGMTLLERLRRIPGVIRSEICGSIRRRRETAKDIDILISSANAEPIMAAFVQFPEAIQVTGHGEKKSSIIASMTLGGEKVVLNADLRVVSDEQFPFAQHYFTGSKEHNVQVRRRAIELGLSLNEYGLTGENRSVACKNEEEIFRALGMDYVPPELREDTGEIDAASAKALPRLVEAKQIRGVFHNHTTASDGTATLAEMAEAAKKLGLTYFGVGDHSQSLKIARGLTVAQVKQQHAEIDAFNAGGHGIHVFKGIESDILEDGSLDYDDATLRRFDYVVASIHTHFGMSTEEMTARICKALAHPATTMLGHATGRLLLRREGYKVDLDRVLEAAARYGKMIEINAQPLRLDLDWTYVKKARTMRIPLVINPDAHATEEIALYEYGVHVARRGWLEAKHVFNTRTTAEVAEELRLRRERWRQE